MSNGGQNDFGHEYEVNSHRAHISAYVLIAGLVLEVINAVIWFHGPETIAGIVAVLLIVGGVWGEVHFAHKARLAGDRQLAQYETRTAEANARAEEAKRDADKIRLELTEFRERRLLSHTDRLSIRTKLGVFRPKFDMGIGDHNDAEQYEFLFELFTLLSNLWVFKDWEGGPIAFVGPLGGIGAVPVNNVSIQVHPEYADSLTIAAKALEGALNAIGIAATFEPLKIPQNRNGDAIHVLIGRKL